MNSITSLSRVTAAALLCGVALAACNAVEDVREEPSTPLPSQQVVLEGKVYGLGIRRSIGLQNGAANRLVQGFPGEPTGPRGRESRFNFGALPDGSTYNVVVRPELVPFGKVCVVNNGAGTLRYNASDAHKGSPQNIEVVCQNDPAVARYDIRVAVPEPFRSAPASRVTLMTEEGIFEADPKDPADGDPAYVWFRDAVVTLPSTGVLPFQNIIKATTETGSTPQLRLVNRCAVANHTFPSPAGTGADVTNVAVGACTFTVAGSDTPSGGAVRYSRPIGVLTDPLMGAGGVTLELRYPNGDPLPSPTGPTTEVTITSFNSNFTFPTMVTSGAECPAPVEGEAPIPCEVRGFYEVVVKSHPAGQRCLAAASTAGLMGPLVTGAPVVPTSSTGNANTNWAGAANLYVLDESIATGTFPANPANYTGVRVYCRNLPAAGRVLTGTYQLTNQAVFTNNVLTSNVPWSPSPAARRLYSHMLTLFDDGTFLFGAHTASDAVNSIGMVNHAEQGFYDYAPNTVIDANNVEAGDKLRFTVHVDSNTGAAVAELNAGLSSTEGPRTVGTGATAVAHRVLARVQIGTGSPRTITGRFGPDGAPVTTAAREVVFTEPLSIDGQLTGNWISEDHLRFWSYNFDTTVGFHAGATGFPNIQDTCLKMDDYTLSSGQYVPSPGGAAVYCSPVGSTFQSNLSSLAHAPPPLLQARLPGWQGWLPGTELGGGSSARSPSPVHFHIAAAGNFFASADPIAFPSASMPSQSWCPTEILGVRPTLNGDVSRKPIYFCRNHTN